MYDRKIMYVVGSLGTGGTEKHLQIISSRLAARGWKITIYCLTAPGELASKIRSSGVDIISFGKKNIRHTNVFVRSLLLGFSTIKLWLFLLRNRQDIVHFFLPEAYLIGAPVAILAGIKYRIMSRRSLGHYQSRYPGLKILESFLHTRMNVILGNSKAVINELLHENIPLAKLRLIYNGVEIPAGKRNLTQIRTSMNLDEKMLVFIVVANLIPYKGHADLLEALAIARNNLPENWCLVLVGRDDGIKTQLFKQATDIGIDSRIRWLGLREDVEDLLYASDIGILCSWEEGFSNSILEGMASGLPMIVTDVGGNPEAVVDNVTGVVIPPGKPEKLVNALVSLSSNKEMREKMGKSGRERVKTYFSIDSCVDKYEELYIALLHNKKLPEFDGNFASSLSADFIHHE